MTVLYTTPSGEYTICTFYDELWKETFGNIEIFYICREVQRDKTTVSTQITRYIFRTEETLDKCFVWFYNKRIISHDELLFQLKNIKLCEEETRNAS